MNKKTLIKALIKEFKNLSKARKIKVDLDFLPITVIMTTYWESEAYPDIESIKAKYTGPTNPVCEKDEFAQLISKLDDNCLFNYLFEDIMENSADFKQYCNEINIFADKCDDLSAQYPDTDIWDILNRI